MNLLAPNPTIVNGMEGGVGIGAAGYPGAAFPYLSTNLDFSAYTDENPDNGQLPDGLSVVESGGAPQPNSLSGSVIVEINGEQVGVLGAVTPYLPSIAGIGNVVMETGEGFSSATPRQQQVDVLVTNLQPEVQALTDAGVNKIILMTHLQEAEIEQALAQALVDQDIPVDIHIGGGSHRVMTNEGTIPPLRLDETQQNNNQLLTPYPQPFTNAGDDDAENTIYYINTGANYRYLSQLIANFDDNGVITEIGEESGTFATDIAGVARLYPEVTVEDLDDVKALADPELVGIIEGVGGLVNGLDANIFGQTDVFLNGIRGDVRTQETNLGNLTADANDFYAEEYLNAGLLGEAFAEFDGIDISFKNGGGIRDIIGQSFVAGGGGELVQLPPAANPNVGKEAGDISQLDISNSLRFNNTLTAGTTTAEGLYEIAEHMVARGETTAGQFGQIGGFAFSYDLTAPARTVSSTSEVTPGERIQSLALLDEDGEVKDVVVQDGELVGDPNRTFSVVTLGFLATGGDSYPDVITNQVNLDDLTEPVTLDGANLVPGSEQDALGEYLAAVFSETPFNQPDTPQAEDERIQNIAVRDDTVIPEEPIIPPTVLPPQSQNFLKPIGTYSSGLFGQSASEINTFDPETQQLFVVNAQSGRIDILDISEPTDPILVSEIDLTVIGGPDAVANSVSFNNGILAVAIEPAEKTDPGFVGFFDAEGTELGSVQVGALPDMVTFTPDGTKVLVANEGEPNDDYTIDPEGSVSIVEVNRSGATPTFTAITAGFTDFNAEIDALRAEGVRIFGPGATVAQDLEPEYIAVSSDSTFAYVGLQEANAIALVDITTGVISEILPLGFKDLSLAENALDVSDRDGAINPRNFDNLFGMYQPDTIATYEVGGISYLVTANEGDSRDYDGFSEEFRIGDEEIVLDPTVFPNAEELKADESLGRLRVTDQLGDTDGDGDFDQLYAFGGRSFSIWTVGATGLDLVFDSGNDLEEITAAAFPDFFNSDNAENNFDNRSDDKGPEPEALSIGTIDGVTYAFLGAERIGGVFVYDISDPTAPEFIQYTNNRNFSVEFTGTNNDGDPVPTPEELLAVGDLGPEGITFIPSLSSDFDQPVLAVSNEVSGTTTLYSPNNAPEFEIDDETEISFPEVESGATEVAGTSVLNLIVGVSSDVDFEDDLGIAVVGVDNGNGSWEYSVDGGTTWIAFGAVSQTQAFLLSASAEIRFIANAGFTGTIEQGVSFRLWDGTYGQEGDLADTTGNGGSTAFSSEIAVASIDIVGPNLPPVVDGDIPAQNAVVNFGYFLDVSSFFSDANDDALTFTATGLPQDLEIDEATGIIIGAPVNAGTFEVSVAADDGTDSIETRFVLQVDPITLPVIPPLPDGGDGGDGACRQQSHHRRRTDRRRRGRIRQGAGRLAGALGR
ncbi:MAG: hypothetical protein HC835_02845, partial [Oscillatoriales cyanobacterium RM2_1_1]|nr:hypothetical protein [Oscillatoriales cyanobacterium RM2_1_1]